MKPKYMTLGEVLIEFVEAFVEYRLLAGTQGRLAGDAVKASHEMHQLRKELLSQLNHIEMISIKED